MPADSGDRLGRVRSVRAQLSAEGPAYCRPIVGDFECVALPAPDCDRLRDALVAQAARVVIEIGLAYGSSALAIGEALLTTRGSDSRHIIIDAFQATAFSNIGWQTLLAAGLAGQARLITEPSSMALPGLVAEGVVADAAFVDGSHRFHEVFVDLYFLRKLVRPRGLIVLDDTAWPSVSAALRYYDVNLDWQPVHIGGRLVGRRMPDFRVQALLTHSPMRTDFALLVLDMLVAIWRYRLVAQRTLGARDLGGSPRRNKRHLSPDQIITRCPYSASRGRRAISMRAPLYAACGWWTTHRSQAYF